MTNMKKITPAGMKNRKAVWQWMQQNGHTYAPDIAKFDAVPAREFNKSMRDAIAWMNY